MAKGLIELQSNVKGLAELDVGLRDLGRDVGLKGLSSATSAGARELRDKARANVPKKSGKLRKNIVVAKYKRIADKSVESRHAVVVRAKGKAKDDKNAFYGYFVEHGHAVLVRRKGQKKLTKKQLRAHALEHGSSKVPAEPFMRPAWESGRQGAANTVIASMEKTIETEKAKKGFK